MGQYFHKLGFIQFIASLLYQSVGWVERSETQHVIASCESQSQDRRFYLLNLLIQ